jgi:putative peptidoglycan lipid II flippase
MASGERHPLLSGTILTSAGTLASRVLGLVRDMVTAALFGLAAGGVLDALVMAFRVPNLFRAFFGEGALTASYLPVFTESLEEDRHGGQRLYRATAWWLGGVLTAVTMVGEIGIGIWAWLVRDDPQVLLLAGLLAALLPYLIFVCLAAVSSATLQALGQFGPPAFAPAVLNVCWIAGVAVLAPRFADAAPEQAYIVAGCILVGGVLQWLAQWSALGRQWRQIGNERHGTQEIDAAPDATRQRLRRIRRGMVPTMVALTVTQLNTLSDSVVAWVLATPPDGSATISWLGNVAYPMKQGAVAAIYLGERIYQLPLGLIGVAAATVAFPLLSRHAARGNRDAVARDLTLGLRLVLLAAVPCAVGLAILPEPIARLLYERGQFTADDVLRAARMIAVYGAAVWAYCALPVLVRGFYAMDDRTTPLRVAVSVVALNLALDLTLIWPLAETGLAVSTAVSAVVQVAALAMLFSKRHVPLLWGKMAVTALRAVVAAAIMGAVCLAVLKCVPERAGTWNALWRVAAPMAAGTVVYIRILTLIGRSEWRDLRGS